MTALDFSHTLGVVAYTLLVVVLLGACLALGLWLGRQRRIVLSRDAEPYALCGHCQDWIEDAHQVVWSCRYRGCTLLFCRPRCKDRHEIRCSFAPAAARGGR